jgi:hypothetical protein
LVGLIGADQQVDQHRQQVAVVGAQPPLGLPRVGSDLDPLAGSLEPIDGQARTPEVGCPPEGPQAASWNNPCSSKMASTQNYSDSAST